jgi:HAD superfamily hydrolase (TIGR01509 family)
MAASAPHSFRAVLFDMDGVLCDSEPLINAAAVAMFEERGVKVHPDDFIPFIGTGENRYIGGVAEAHGVELDIVEAKRRTYEIYLDLVPTRLHAFPGAVRLVLACRAKGLQTAVASSADLVKIRANLNQIGLPEGSWDAVVFGDEVERKKPAPDIFLRGAQKLGRAPGECVVVEDAVAGIEAALAAGMRCVAVATSYPESRLATATVVRRTIAEVRLEDLLGTTATIQ